MYIATLVYTPGRWALKHQPVRLLITLHLCSPGTANAPADQPDHLESALYRDDQRTPTVALATVPAALLVPRTQEVLRVNSLFPGEK